MKKVLEVDKIEYVIGFDIGTGSFKAVLMTKTGEVVVERDVEYKTAIAMQCGLAEQDADEWISAMQETLVAIRDEYGINLHDIVSVCPTGMHRSLVLMGKDRKPLRNAIIWSDIRCANEVREAEAAHGEKLWDITKTRLSPAATLPRLIWLRKHEPEILEMTDTFLYPSNYLAWYLTGNPGMDRNNASASSLYDMRTHEWSPEIMRLFGINANIMPQLLDSLDIQGYVTEQAASETGLRVGTPVTAGIADASAEIYSLALSDSNTCKIRLGSAGDVTFVIEQEAMEKQRRDSIIDYMPRGFYVDSNYILTCAQAVKWARKMFWRELPESSGSFAIMDKEAENIPIGSDGILFHPFLLGENSPYYDSELRGMFHGLALHHERGHMLRAVYEGLSYCFHNILDKKNILDQCSAIYVVGGGTKSALWLSILVDMLGRNILLPKQCDAAYGAALMAGESAGFWNTKAFIEEKNKQAQTLVPNPDNARYYDSIFPKFREIAEAALQNPPAS